MQDTGAGEGIVKLTVPAAGDGMADGVDVGAVVGADGTEYGVQPLDANAKAMNTAIENRGIPASTLMESS